MIEGKNQEGVKARGRKRERKKKPVSRKNNKILTGFPTTSKREKKKAYGRKRMETKCPLGMGKMEGWNRG